MMADVANRSVGKGGLESTFAPPRHPPGQP
jgi:hypothetical protein